MATEDVTDKDLEKIRNANSKLAEQIAEEERKLAEAQVQASRRDSKAQLENENERLKARLADLKNQVQFQNKASTPTEQAEAAAKAEQEAASQPVTTDDTEAGK